MSDNQIDTSPCSRAQTMSFRDLWMDTFTDSTAIMTSEYNSFAQEIIDPFSYISLYDPQIVMINNLEIEQELTDSERFKSNQNSQSEDMQDEVIQEQEVQKIQKNPSPKSTSLKKQLCVPSIKSKKLKLKKKRRMNQQNQRVSIKTKLTSIIKKSISKNKNRVGRPYKGKTYDDKDLEKNFDSKRSIFRCFKRLWGQKGLEYLNELKKNSSFFQNFEYSQFIETFKDHISFQEACKKCVSLDYIRSQEKNQLNQNLNQIYQKLKRKPKSEESRKKEYFPEIGDVCYRYSKEEKQNFFKDPVKKFAFCLIIPLLEEKVKTMKPKKPKPGKETKVKEIKPAEALEKLKIYAQQYGADLIFPTTVDKFNQRLRRQQLKSKHI